ncbi:MAG: c-type cytochrome [Verrucomicrobia bacterium]|nr:c-type cytochrome [Verrucomicrobiota bacterium]
MKQLLNPKPFLAVLAAFTLALTPAGAADAKAKAPKAGAKKGKAAKRAEPAGPNATNIVHATPAEKLVVAKGFKVELLYTVPAESQGSWVNLCLDGKGRIIASDQYGGLFRFPAPPAGKPLDPKTIEKIPADIRAVNGMLWAFGALYVAVNDYEKKIDSGLYRITSSKGDDTLDTVEKLRAMEARGDHGVHALLLSPDGKSLTLITGNGTKPTEFNSSRVPPHWGEDHLLPRMPDGKGFMRDVLAPGGIIYKVSPDGKDWEIVANGFRNIFDGAYNRDGELFTYDADMEYDFNTPWYRPTRICHVVSGAEFGWRNGAGKWPAYYEDSVPAAVDIGPGSPTGATFGYGAKFPAKYQNALFGCDWSWGKLYAVHLQPKGATYTGEKEEFISGAPLPLTDVIVRPQDGAMYFTIGGRRAQSALYRVTYVGSESTAPVLTAENPGAQERELRRHLESFHGHASPAAVPVAWAFLGDNDRSIRWAARVAIEHQPVGEWQEKALHEKDSNIAIEALLALVRVTGIDPFHRRPDSPPVDKALQRRILDALNSVDWDWKRLDHQRRLALLRAYAVCFVRFGPPDAATAKSIATRLEWDHYPAATRELNADLTALLVYLQSPRVAPKAIKLLTTVPTQEEQMEYARSLRMLTNGWTAALRDQYFKWFQRAQGYRGGASFEKFMEFIQNDAVASLPADAKRKLQPMLDAKPQKTSPLEAMAAALAGRSFVKEWKVDDLAPQAERRMTKRSFENGRKMFGATGCFACHRFANEGGMTGPDLTAVGARFGVRDLLVSIIEPSKEISDQFAPTVITKNDGDSFTGVIVNLNGDGVTLNTDLFDPNQRVTVNRKEVKSIELSKVSLMPEGLLNVLKQDEILDLLAYLISAGDPKHAVFR